MLYPVWWYPDKKTQTTITTMKGYMTNKVYGITDVIHEVKRMANAMEEILRLVKADQAQSQAQREKDEEEQSWPTGLGKEENAKEKN